MRVYIDDNGESYRVVESEEECYGLPIPIELPDDIAQKWLTITKAYDDMVTSITNNLHYRPDGTGTITNLEEYEEGE